MRVQVCFTGYLFAFAVLFSSATYSQTPAYPPPTAQAASAPHYEYAVSSVKPDKSEGSHWRTTTDGFSATMTVKGLIIYTYALRMPDQISGLPGWASSENFAVEAKMDPETMAALAKLPPAERWQTQQTMLQALLADRFGLKVHRSTKELPIWALTAVDAGKLKKSVGDTAGGASYFPGKMTAHGMSIDDLAMTLPNTVGKIVVNQTGLEGRYDFALEWAPEGADASDPRPSIFTALEEQVGLKLKPAQGPVEAIVVDAIQLPSEN